MKLYDIVFDIDGTTSTMRKFVFADSIIEAKAFIKNHFNLTWAYITFIDVQEIEIKKGILF